jgi:hypothetical protein
MPLPLLRQVMNVVVQSGAGDVGLAAGLGVLTALADAAPCAAGSSLPPPVAAPRMISKMTRPAAPLIAVGALWRAGQDFSALRAGDGTARYCSPG